MTDEEKYWLVGDQGLDKDMEMFYKVTSDCYKTLKHWSGIDSEGTAVYFLKKGRKLSINLDSSSDIDGGLEEALTIMCNVCNAMWDKLYDELVRKWGEQKVLEVLKDDR